MILSYYNIFAVFQKYKIDIGYLAFRDLIKNILYCFANIAYDPRWKNMHVSWFSQIILLVRNTNDIQIFFRSWKLSDSNLNQPISNDLHLSNYSYIRSNAICAKKKNRDVHWTAEHLFLHHFNEITFDEISSGETYASIALTLQLFSPKK